MAAPMDNVVLHLSSNICDKNNGFNDKIHLLHVLDQLQVLRQQKTGSIQDIISHIHSCLSSSKQRLEGLLLLERLVDQCVTDVFIQNTLVWLRFILQILQSHDPVYIQKLSCRVCCRILDQASTFTVLSRDISSLVPQLIPVLISSSSQWKEEAFGCIISCIDNFPGSCATFKGKIESFVVQELDKGLLYKEAARCYAVLARCGGSGNLGIKHTDGWTNQCNKLLGSLQMTITDLFEGLQLSYSPSQTKYTSTLPLSPVTDIYPDRMNSLARRFVMLSSCMESLLSESFSVTVKVPVTDIIDIVSHALSVNSKILKNKTTTERLSLFTQLPTIHTSAVLIIRGLINSCKNLLLPYTKQIINMLVQELIWTKTPVQYGQCRPYSALRMCVYETLTLWFQNAGVLVDTTSEEEDLIDAILYDVKPHQDTVKIDKQGQLLSEATEPPPVKKKKKGGYQEISHGISTQRKIDDKADCKLTVAALDTVYWLLTSVGETLQTRSVKSIQDFVISTSLMINQQRRNPGIPYHHSDCRLNLYKVLQACVLVPHSEAPCPLRCVLSIYRMGIQDSDNHVASYCKECLRICEVLIHPRAPCFTAPFICNSTVNGINSSQSVIYRSNEAELQTTRTNQSADSDHSKNKGPLLSNLEASTENSSKNLPTQYSLGIQGSENLKEHEVTNDVIRQKNDDRLATNVSNEDTDNPMASSSSMVKDNDERNSLAKTKRNEPENIIVSTIDEENVTCQGEVLIEDDNEDIGTNEDESIDIYVQSDTYKNDGEQDSGGIMEQEEDHKVAMDTVDLQHESDDEELGAMLSSFKDTDPDT